MIRLLILILALPFNAFACSCFIAPGPLTIKNYNEGQYIFSGKAVKVVVNTGETLDKQRQIEFKIDEVFKGRIETKQVTVYTSLSDASCGLYVRENEEWIIWAYLKDGVITTDLCTRSTQRQYVSGPDLKSLRYFKSNPAITEWKNASGILLAVGKLENNIPVGYWKYFYDNGNIEQEGRYENGVYEGKWIKYMDPQGIVTRLRYDKKIPADSTPDLQPLHNKVLEIQHYRKGIRDGAFIYYDYNSMDKPRRIVSYKDGYFDGKSIAYYDNGLIYYEQNYQAGKLNGAERFYHLNGRLKQEGWFVEGKATGKFNVYSEDGVLIKTTIDKRPDQ